MKILNMQGQIIKIIAGFYDILSQEKVYRVKGSGNLRNQNITPLVGDYVEFTKNQFLNKVLPRKNFLIRPKVANIDQVVVVMSLKEPLYSSFLLDKMLAYIEFHNLKTVIIFTKKDLTSKSYLKEYQKLGYKNVFEISNTKDESQDNSLLSQCFMKKLSVFMGQSGVGKSSTINKLANMDLPTQSISQSLGRGKHTTRVIEIFPFNGGQIIDTPGFSKFDLNLTKQELSRSYFIFKKFLSFCQFPKNCLHHHEQKCGIKQAVAKNQIGLSRYQNYLKLLETID